MARLDKVFLLCHDDIASRKWINFEGQMPWVLECAFGDTIIN